MVKKYRDIRVLKKREPNSAELLKIRQFKRHIYDEKHGKHLKTLNNLFPFYLGSKTLLNSFSSNNLL